MGWTPGPLLDARQNHKLPYRLKLVRWKRSRTIWWKIPILFRFFAATRVSTIYLNSWDDASELEHEYRHVVQQNRDGFWHWLWRYVFRKVDRANYEAEAIAARVKFKVDAGTHEPELTIRGYANRMAENYGLDWTPERCAELIRTYYTELVTDG